MKTVLVTGASTGIGWDSVRALIDKGYQVVATVRNEADAAKLKQAFQQKVIPIILDVVHFDRVD